MINSEEKKKKLQEEYKTNRIKINQIEQEIYELSFDKEEARTVFTYILTTIVYTLAIIISRGLGTTILLENTIPSLLVSLVTGEALSKITIEGLKKISGVKNTSCTQKELKEKILSLEIEKEYLEHLNFMIKNTFDSIDETFIKVEDSEEAVRNYQESLDLTKKICIRDRINYAFYKYRERVCYEFQKALSSFLITGGLVGFLMCIPSILYGVEIPITALSVAIPYTGLIASAASVVKSEQEKKIYNRMNNSLLDLKMDNDPDPKWIETHNLFRKPNDLYVEARKSLQETTVKRISNMRNEDEIISLSDIYPKEEIINVDKEPIKEDIKVRKLTK